MKRTARAGRRASVTAVGGVLAVAVVVAVAVFGVWWFVIRDTSNGPGKAPGSTANAVSEQDLEGLSASLNQPIYWIGPKANTTYELTQTPTGRTYVRYLPPGVEIGSPQTYLTIGTYPFENAYAATVATAHERNSVIIRTHAGEIAFYSRTTPLSVYVSFVGSPYQIEVYDPVPGAARTIVAKGELGRVDAIKSPVVAKTAAVAVLPAQLKALGKRLGRPVYWAGAQTGVTYELTQTPDGRVYIRYLPPGVKVGSETPYLTVGTYPLLNAYPITLTAAAQHNAVRIPIKHGVAFYDTSTPTSVHLAFPGIAEQIEVYDPSATIAHKTVSSGKVSAVSS